MDSSTSRSRACDGRREAGLFRAFVVGVSVLLLALGARSAHSFPTAATLLVFTLILVSRAFPVAISREKPITFTASIVFASAILVNGIAAGWSALLACALHARFAQRGGRAYAVFIGAQYALAAMASHRAFTFVSRTASPSAHLGLVDLSRALLAASVFLAVNAALVAIGNLGTPYASLDQAKPVIRAHAIAYGISFPFALLLVLAYRSFGVGSLLCLAAPLAICARAVRAWIENQALVRQLAAVEAMGRACASSVDAQKPLQRFLALSRELIAFDRAVLWLADESLSNLTASSVYPERSPLPDPVEAGPESLIARAMDRSTPILVSDASRDPRQPAWTESASWILYPVVLHGRTIGVAQFVRSARQPFTQTEVQRLSILVPQTAVAYESVRVRHLMHRYADLATTDGLTGLLNHRQSQEILRKEVDRASRYHRPLSILMVDVDGFKQFNDSYGHPQGDVLLRSIAGILRDSVRNTDYVGRYGGEEFIAILPETKRDEASVLAERIRIAVQDAWFDAGDGSAVRKTISVGVAAFPDDATRAADLLQYADDALYRAKRSGKNRVLTA